MIEPFHFHGYRFGLNFCTGYMHNTIGESVKHLFYLISCKYSNLRAMVNVYTKMKSIYYAHLVFNDTMSQ